MLYRHTPSLCTVPVICVIRWSHNRPEDDSRVKAIRKRAEQKGYIDGVISLAYLESEQKGKRLLQCYDGNHRRVAMSFFMSPVLISVLWEATPEMVAEEFNAINQAVSVPLVYMGGKIDVNMKIAVVEFVSKLSKLYPAHCSQSKACQIPNFNRDQLTDHLTDMIAMERYSHLSAEKVITYLELTNICYLEEKHGFQKSKLKSHIASKCQKTGLWLFATQRGIDQAYFQTVISKHANK